jgi:hypothetical protein
MNDQEIMLDLGLLTMPSERQLDDWNSDGTDEEKLEDEEYEFNFDPGPLSPQYSQSHIEHEKEVFDRLNSAINTGNFDAVLLSIQNELYEDVDGFAMYPLGIGGLVLSLAAFGCVPVEGDADEIAEQVFPCLHPWVTFYTPVEKVSVLLTAAQGAGVFLKNGFGGSIDASCDDVRKFNAMAERLCNQLLIENN